MTEREKKALAGDAYASGFDAGLRRGRIEARAELTALWRARVADVLTILQAPVPNQAPSKPVQETK